MKIPFVDLYAQHEELREEIDSVFRDVIDRSSFIGGPLVDAFENNFAAFCQVKHAIGCASGTDALKLALMAAGITAGEEVVTVANTFIATVEAITRIGAFPCFVDIDCATYNMNADKLRAFLYEDCRLRADGQLLNRKTGRRITAILPVHLYGLPADMSPIMAEATGIQADGC